MSDVTIRQLTKDDAADYRDIRLEMLQDKSEAFGELYESCVSKDLSFFEGRIETSPIWGAYSGNKLIGTAGYFIFNGDKTKHKAYLWGVYVKSDFRGMNISYDLTVTVLDALPSSIKLIQLNVVENNPAALKTYKRAGFKEWGFEESALEDKGKYYNEIHMVKFL